MSQNLGEKRGFLRFLFLSKLKDEISRNSKESRLKTLTVNPQNPEGFNFNKIYILNIS